MNSIQSHIIFFLEMKSLAYKAWLGVHTYYQRKKNPPLYVIATWRLVKLRFVLLIEYSYSSCLAVLGDAIWVIRSNLSTELPKIFFFLRV